MTQIRVMLVDDSAFFLGTLETAIAKDPGIAVVAKAMNGEDALAAVPSVRPDVILCDVQMPKMSGIEFLKKLLPKHQIPVVVVSGTPNVTLTALNNGAVDFIPKPGPDETKADFFSRVISTIRIAAQANMSAKARTAAALNVPAKPAAPAASRPAVFMGAPDDVVVAIGASTGGTDAILEVVRGLPANFPPVLATQHMPAGFTAMYAARLDKECKMTVHEATDGARVQRGHMLLAAGEHHMRLMRDSKGYYISSRPGPKVNGHVPSVEVLFNSVADVAGKRAVGIILTGMGGDGAEGLLRMRKAGAFTMGQDKESSVVYGMPMVAFNKGAVSKQLPLDKITSELIRSMNGFR